MNTKGYLMLTVLALIYILPANNSIAQSYVAFPKDSAFWREDVSEECWHGTMELKHYEYSFSGDTIINLKSYKKIFLNAYGPCSGGGYFGALFDDTLSGKVFIIPPGDSVENILYDFTLNVGDTIRGYFDNGLNHTITSVDTVTFGGISRKRFTFSGGFDRPYYIEGIGSATGLLENIAQYWIYSTLLCFSVNGNAIYPDSILTCGLFNSTKEIENQFRVSVFPNPFSEATNFNFEVGSVDELILSDISGIEMKKYNLKGDHFILEAHDLASGIYFYTLKKGNRVITIGKLGIFH